MIRETYTFREEMSAYNTPRTGNLARQDRRKWRAESICFTDHSVLYFPSQYFTSDKNAFVTYKIRHLRDCCQLYVLHFKVPEALHFPT